MPIVEKKCQSMMIQNIKDMKALKQSGIEDRP